MAKKSGEAIIDLLLRGMITLPIPGLVLPQGLSLFSGLPLNVWALATIVSVKLLPLSAFPKLETAATWLLWIFIGLMFAGAGWKQMLLMLAIGGVAMGFLSSLGVFAVADSEIAASYNDLVQNTKMKNQTASGVSNVWLMLSNPRLWYEQNYGFKNDTLAQGMQTSPFALEITKAEVLEKVAPPGGDATFDIRLENKGKRPATVVSLKTYVGTENGVGKKVTENLGSQGVDVGKGKNLYNAYDRYLKSAVDTDAKITELREKQGDPDRMYSYFESTPDVEAHYKFCDNPATSGTVDKELKGVTFEDGSIDEVFGTFKSPQCYGRHKVSAELTYSYSVTGTYNLELISKDYFAELVRYKKLKTHIEDSRSTEGPLKLTIRSVPEEQPVRADTPQGITVFYSLNNVGPGTAIIDSRDDIYLEQVDTALTIVPSECDFDAGDKRINDLTKVNGATKLKDATGNFYTMWGDVPTGKEEVYRAVPEGTPKLVHPCAFQRKFKAEDVKPSPMCLTFSPDDPNSVVLLKCKFTYSGQIDTTKTLFMKMHVNYDYITSRTAQYDTMPMPGYHSCVTKRALDGFPDKTMMDLYLKEVFKDVLDRENTGAPPKKIGSLWTENGGNELKGGSISGGTITYETNLCPKA